MPDWLAKGILIASGLLAFVSFVTGMVLFYRAENPYRLAAADWKQRWIWTARLPILLFVIPLCTLFVSITIAYRPDQLRTLSFYQGLVLFALFFFIPFTLAFRVRLSISQWQNERYSRMLKNPKMRRIVQHGYFKTLRRLFGPIMGRDRKRFLEEGFPDEGETGNKGRSKLQT